MNRNTVDTLSASKLTLLFFYSEESSLEDIKRIEKYMQEKIPGLDVLKIQVRANPKVCKSFKIDSDTTPAVLILQDGKELGRQSKVFSGPTISSFLKDTGMLE